MAMPDHVYIARNDAYERIVAEALRVPEHETGGILVGRMFCTNSANVLVVAAASGPGKPAPAYADMYVPDTLARQRELEIWRAMFAPHRLDYVGEWHTHPAIHPRPSYGDTCQVNAIFADTAYQLPDGIFTPIVIVEHGSCRLHGFYYPRETRHPTAVECTVIDSAIEPLMRHLATLDEGK